MTYGPSDQGQGRERFNWTDAEMRGATPLGLSDAEGPTSRSKPEPDGPSGTVPGRSVGDIEAQPPRTGGAGDGIEALGYSYPGPYTRYTVPREEATTYPRSTVGVLFFRQDGKSYRCSASVVSKFAIFTAGHCVSNGAGGWSSDLLFIPAYDGTKQCPGAGCPLGKWRGVTEDTWVLSSWHLLEDYSSDMGGAVLKKKKVGNKMKPIGKVTGWLGFAWNQGVLGTNAHWNLFGYPSQSPFDGQRLVTCQASYAYSPLFETIAVGCDMTKGSSGGPWIQQFGTSNYQNGVNSFKRIGFDHELASPYFDFGAYCLFDALKRSRPGNPIDDPIC